MRLSLSSNTAPVGPIALPNTVKKIHMNIRCNLKVVLLFYYYEGNVLPENVKNKASKEAILRPKCIAKGVTTEWILP